MAASTTTSRCEQRNGGLRAAQRAAPTVSKLAPAKGPVAGNQKVKITGLNFENPTVTGVDFQEIAAKGSR